MVRTIVWTLLALLVSLGSLQARAQRSGPKAPPTSRRPLRQASFEQYIQWLHSLEKERARLRAHADTREFVSRAPAALNKARQMGATFRHRISPPPFAPPADCKALHTQAVGALGYENMLALAALDTLIQGDQSGTRLLLQTGKEAETKFTRANELLTKVYAAHRRTPDWQFKTGTGASLLGKLIELQEARPNPPRSR